MKNILHSALLIIALWICAGTAAAQVATGTPPLGSFGGGPFDSVNLANLNVHLDIPVLSKAGRGLPFTYDLGYDSSVWYPLTSGSATSWQPALNWGWVGQTEGATGTLNNSYIYFCIQYYGTECYSVWYNYVYIDPFGSPHPIALAAVSPGNTACNGQTMTIPGTCISTDASGYAIYLTNTSISILQASGAQRCAQNSRERGHCGTLSNAVILPPQNTNTGTAGETDSNGNEITVNSSGQFYDTLSSTTPVLTIAGSGTPSSPTTLTYPAPGASAVYKMNYTNYTVATNFGVSGITEYKSSGPVPLVTSIVLPDGKQYTFQYESTPSVPASGACTPYAGTTCVTGRITSVQLPTTGTISYSYSGGPNNNGIFADGSTATLQRTTPDSSTAWKYAHTENGTEWSTTANDPLGDETDLTFQSVRLTSQYGSSVWQSYETERDVKQLINGNQTLLQTAYNCYNGASEPCNSTAITLPITRKTSYPVLPNGSGHLESETDTHYDSETCGSSTCSNGLVTDNFEYGYGTSGPGSLLRHTVITYASLGNNNIGKPASVTVCSRSGTASACNGVGTVVAQAIYQYDQTSVAPTSNTPQHVTPTGSRGNLTTISGLVSGSTFLSKTFTYFDTGNVQYEYDVNSSSAKATYNYPDPNSTCGNAFPTSVNELIGLTMSMTWNCTGAVATSATDENGKTVSASYTDSYFWRPYSSTDELQNTTTLSYPSDITVESTLNFGSSTSDILATEDSLGRPMLSQTKEGPNSSTYDSVETYYDSLGRPYATTLPYAANAGAACSGTCPASTTAFDALGRPLTITDGGGGTITYSYAGNDVYISAGPHPSGENTKRKQLEYDALGRLTSVCEITSGTGNGTCSQTSQQTGYWTQYMYDVLGDLTNVTQNAQSSPTESRSYTYDALGRMTKAIDPESGTTNYTFDTDSTCGTSAGDLVKKTDAAGDTICFSYALHRMTSTTYSGTYASVTPNRYFVYDSATIGSRWTMSYAESRLAEAYTATCSTCTKITDSGFSYTPRGEVQYVYESTPHSTGYNGYNWVYGTYWANGAPDLITNNLGNLSGFTYTPDGEGRINSISAGTGQNPVTSTSYNPASQPLQVSFGSSDSDSFTYDPNTDRMKTYTFNVNAQSVVGTLNWNPLGTLGTLTITDPFNASDAQTCNYTHDDLARIASSNCGSAASQTFSYDAFGNIDKSGSPYSFVPTYSLSPSTNHIAQVNSCYPTYDGNGNATYDCLHRYQWDANGHPVNIDGVNLTYDALGRMVEQNRSGAYTEIVYAPSGAKFALMNGSTVERAYIPLTNGAGRRLQFERIGVL